MRKRPVGLATGRAERRLACSRIRLARRKEHRARAVTRRQAPSIANAPRVSDEPRLSPGTRNSIADHDFARRRERQVESETRSRWEALLYPQCWARRNRNQRPPDTPREGVAMPSGPAFARRPVGWHVRRPNGGRFGRRRRGPKRQGFAQPVAPPRFAGRLGAGARAP